MLTPGYGGGLAQTRTLCLRQNCKTGQSVAPIVVDAPNLGNSNFSRRRKKESRTDKRAHGRKMQVHLIIVRMYIYTQYIRELIVLRLKETEGRTNERAHQCKTCVLPLINLMQPLF